VVNYDGFGNRGSLGKFNLAEALGSRVETGLGWKDDVEVMNDGIGPVLDCLRADPLWYCGLPSNGRENRPIHEWRYRGGKESFPCFLKD
jgi:hypothetical protein